MKFTLITYILHKKNALGRYTYEPYIREMNLWLKYADHVTIVAPEINSSFAENEEAYLRRDYTFRKIPEISFTSLKQSLKSLVKIPLILKVLVGTMKDSDHIHLRCPGNIGLLGCVCQLFFPSKVKTVKYAGNWDPKAREPLSYKLQKWILGSTLLSHNIKVLVYGDWPSQSSNIIPFFTASFSEKIIREVREKDFGKPFTFLFVGSLEEGKRPISAITLVEELNKKFQKRKNDDAFVKLELYGDGSERKRLEDYVHDRKLQECVIFKGSRSINEIKEAYQKAHFLVLLSRSEGWPKAIAEAMFFGCIPVATPVSCVPYMLGHGKRGILVREIQKTTAKPLKRKRITREAVSDMTILPIEVERIFTLLNTPEEMQIISNLAKEWSQQFTLEKFEGAIQNLVADHESKILF